MSASFAARCTGIAAIAMAAVAGAAENTRFAAPETAASLPSGGASGIGQVTFALLLVLAAVFAAAWMMKRLRVASGASQGIEVLGSAALGTKERAVIVKVGQTRLLLGVATGSVTLLHTLPPGEPLAGEPVAPPAHRPGFADLLKKSLGR